MKTLLTVLVTFIATSAAGQNERPVEPITNLGINLQFLSGIMLVDRSSAGGADVRYSPGASLSWEFGHLTPARKARIVLLADLRWQQSESSSSTQDFSTRFIEHEVSLAPAIGYQLTDREALTAYLQVGGGLDSITSIASLGGSTFQTSGVEPLFQYGLGLRAQRPFFGWRAFNLSARLEVMRFMRGLATDTYFGLGVGGAF